MESNASERTSEWPRSFYFISLLDLLLLLLLLLLAFLSPLLCHFEILRQTPILVVVVVVVQRRSSGRSRGRSVFEGGLVAQAPLAL